MATRDDIIRLKIDVEGKDAQRVLDRFAAKAQQTATKTTREAKKMETGFKGVRSSLLGVSLAVGTLTAAAFTLDRFFQRAERLDSISRGFRTLTRRVDQNADVFLTKMRRASAGFVSDAELMKQANNALILGLPVTADSMGKLVDNAVKLGRALGVDATRAIESVVTGIGRQSRLMLDNIGIVVKVEEANRKYAQSLGISTSELTDAQKKLAFYNATVAAAETASKGLTNEVETMADAWAVAKTNLTNYLDELVRFANRPTGAGFADTFLPAGLGVLNQLGAEARRQDQTEGFLPFGRETIGGAAAAIREQEQEVRNLDLALEAIGQKYDAQRMTLEEYRELMRQIRTDAEFMTRLSQESGPGFFPTDTGTPTDFSPIINPEELMNVGLMAEEFDTLSTSLEINQAQWFALGDAVAMGTSALIDAAAAGSLSARSLANAIGLTVKQTLKALTVEFATRALSEVAFGFAAKARGDFGAAANHFASAKMFGIAAGAAGAGAIVAGRLVGSGGGPGGGGTGGGLNATGGRDFRRVSTPQAADGRPVQEVRIFLEGQGVIQDPESFSRILMEAARQQGSRAGI